MLAPFFEKEIDTYELVLEISDGHNILKHTITIVVDPIEINEKKPKTPKEE